MEKFSAPKNLNLTALPSSNTEEREKQIHSFTQLNFGNLVTSLVTDNIKDLLSKDDLEELSEEKYESSVAQPAREGEQRVRQERQGAAEAYAELNGCDPDLTALLDPPTERDMKEFLTHGEK